MDLNQTIEEMKTVEKYITMIHKMAGMTHHVMVKLTGYVKKDSATISDLLDSDKGFSML